MLAPRQELCPRGGGSAWEGPALPGLQPPWPRRSDPPRPRWARRKSSLLDSPLWAPQHMGTASWSPGAARTEGLSCGCEGRGQEEQRTLGGADDHVARGPPRVGTPTSRGSVARSSEGWTEIALHPPPRACSAPGAAEAGELRACRAAAWCARAASAGG